MKNLDSASRTIQTYFQKGISALEKSNYDYAIEMLIQVVIAEPHIIEARKALHQAEQKRYASNPPSLVTKLLAALNITNTITRFLAIVYECQNNHEKAIAFYEELLKVDLVNKHYLRRIAHNALKAKWIDVAIVALESLFILSPNDADIPQSLGELYRDKQDVENATRFFNASLKINPLNQKLSKELKDLEALRTIQTGGWEKSGSYRTKLKNEEEATELEQANKRSLKETQATDVEKKLKHALQEDKQNHKMWLTLIDFYLEKNMLAPLDTLFNEATQHFPDNEQIENRQHTFQKKVLTDKISRIDQQLQKNAQNTALLQEKDVLTKKILSLDLSRLVTKVAQYPNDLSLKFELGQAYFILEKYDNAIVEYQQAVKDPALATRALNQLGLAFHNKQMYDLAALQFTKALEKIAGINDTSKNIIYNLGTTYEAMGKKEEAFTEYKKIYEIDISFRDIAQKIEQFYKK